MLNNSLKFVIIFKNQFMNQKFNQKQDKSIHREKL